MAQQRRMVYGKTFASHTINEMPIEARYLYIAMIVLADDDGRLNGSEKYLKGQVFSYDDNITTNMVKEWRDMLAGAHQINLYVVGNNEYISHPNWKDYQTIRGDMYVSSTIPKPLRTRNEDVTEAVHKLNQVKLSKVKGIEGTISTPKDEASKFFEMCQSPENEDYNKFLVDLNLITKIGPEVIRSEVRKFCAYWTEKNKSGTKQKWELERTFEVQRRLAKWFTNAQKWSKESQVSKYKAASV